MDKFTIKQISTAGLIAAVYVVLTVAFMPISFGVYQVRFAEALTILPFLTPAAIPGLFIGCLLSNIIGGMGWLDIVFGPLLTLAAALLTHSIAHSNSLNRIQKLIFAPLSPVLFNAIGVSLYLAPLLGFNYWFTVQMIGVGEMIACYVLGLPLLILLEKRKIFN